MKRIIRMALALFTALVVFMISLPASALSFETKIISGEFRYYSSVIDDVLTHTYYYCDDYFSGSGKVVNEHLRTMSLDLALSAYGSYDSEKNVTSILKNIGFDGSSFDCRQMSETPTENSLGTVIGLKKTQYGDIVAVVVRGIGYGLEWVNNVDVGNSGPAEGFSRAAALLTGRINEYVDKRGLKGAKIWMTGYSRGGGLVDLAGKYINEHLSDYSMTADDLYAYSFEAPAVSDTGTEYNNIHNVMNVNDPIIMLFPRLWGFSHCGTDDPIIIESPRLRLRKLRYIGKVGIEETGKFASMTDIENDFIDLLASSISREKFAENSMYIGDLIRILLTLGYNDSVLFSNYLLSSFGAVFERFPVFDIVKLLAEKEGSSAYKKDVEKLSRIIEEELDAHDHSGLFSDSEYADMKTAITKTFILLIPAVKADFSLSHPLERICSFFGNMDVIISQHFSDTVLGPTESHDSYYHPVSVSGAVITVDETTAEVTSVMLGTKKLLPGIDYTLRYKDESGNYIVPVRSGKYTAEITGIGSYTGTAEKSFTVKFVHTHSWKFTEKGDTVCVMCTAPECEEYGTGVEYSVRVSVADKEYDGLPAEGKLEVSSGFPSEMTIKDIVYTSSGTNDKDKSAIGRYTARAAVYVTDSPGLGASARCSYNIKRITAQPDKLMLLVADDLPSDNEVYYDGKKLTELNDYTVSFTDKNGAETATPTTPGEYNIVWHGRGIYTGTVTKPFVLRSAKGTQILVIPVIIAISVSSAAIVVTVVVALIICLRRKT